MIWHGATPKEARYYNKIFSILLPVLGASASIKS
jgi:hypothetical protein